MWRTFFICLQILTSVSSFAQTPREKWEGYRNAVDLRSENLPFQRFIENSVLQIATVGGSGNFERNPETGSITHGQYDIVNIDNEPKVTDPEIINHNLRVFQIETCRKQNLKRCPVMHNVKTVTLFVNNGKAWTCRHSFHNWLVLASKENNKPVHTLSPPMKIRQLRQDDPTKMRVVYNSGLPDEELLQMSFFQRDASSNILYYGYEYPTKGTFVVPFDIVQMVRPQKSILSEEISLPEASSRYYETIKSKSEVYAVGFGRTNERNEAVINQLVVSHGFIAQDSVIRENYFFDSSNFSSGGMSGGPLISADGTILGMACYGGGQTSDPAQVITSSISIDLDFINSLWTSHGYPSGSVPLRSASLGN